jgi:hypothetical protein
MRPALVPTWLCAASSHSLLGILAGFALHVRLGLGHWPKPMWENYTTPLTDAHMMVFVVVAFVTVYVAPPLWLVLVCIPRFRGGWRIHLLQLLIYGVGWGIIGLWCLWDPFQFLQWLAD